MPHNIAHSLTQVVEQKGGEVGLIEAKSGNQYTFQDLNNLSDRFAHYLSSKGVKSGDRVMLMVKPSAHFISLTFALFKIGAPVILIDPGMGYKNLLRCVENVKPVALIGIPKAHLFTKIFKSPFKSIQFRFCCGNSFGFFGQDISTATPVSLEPYPVFSPNENDLAAIIFTTGSTGPPKGVRYEHTIFAAQLEHIQKFYKIGFADIDQPAFPLFALFSTALGACAVIPDMDATRPAELNPSTFVNSLTKYNVTYSFGSPALWNVVSNYCISRGIILKKLKKILMAGAPVSGELVERVSLVLTDDAEIHTPYGATESLPIVSIEGKEIVQETWNETQKGRGTCVGRPLPGIELRVISIHDGKLSAISADMFLPEGEIGEIIVSGNVVTKAYDNNDRETQLAKVTYNNTLWHRMGDTGYLDKDGRLWFCGRKAHRVTTSTGTMYTIPCEAIINNHPDVFRSALVGVPTQNDYHIPVIVLELEKNSTRSKSEILYEIKKLAVSSQLTADIRHFLFHPKFPVDIRHNAKIFREKLALWAAKKINKNG